MKRKLSLVLATAMVAMSLVACGGSKQEAPKTETKTEEKTDAKTEEKTDAATNTSAVDGNTEPAYNVEVTDDMKAKAKEFAVGMVTDTGGIDDRSFNQGTWEGVQVFGKMTGATVNYKQSNAEADYVPNLSSFAEDGSNLIVAAGFLFKDSMQQVADANKDSNFLIIDEVIDDRDNVASATFASNEASYLVGVAAAESAKAAGKTKVGFVGGGDFPLIHSFEAGYREGVKSVDPKMEILSQYVGDFSNSGKGQSIAAKMYDEGAYVIFHAAGGAGNGVIKEAKDRMLGGKEAWVIGVDKDQYADGIYKDDKSVILTSMLKKVNVAAFDVSMRTLQGKFPAKETLVYNIANGGVGIPDKNPNLSEDVIKKVEAAKEKIKSGEVKVPTEVQK